MADKALSFDGLDDYINSANNLGVNGDSSRTVESWIRLDSLPPPGSAMAVVSTGIIGTGRFFEYGPYNLAGTMRCWLNLWGVGKDYIQNYAFVAETWYHFVAILTKTGVNQVKVTFYVNGTIVGSQSADITEIDTAADLLTIGHRDGYALWVDGVVDEVRISNIARTPEEILANWNNGLGKKLEVDEHTVALWHMDEGEGGTIFDETENGNDGTIVGASWVDGFPFPSVSYYHGLKVQGVGELALCDVGTNPLRIRKGDTTYGIELVATDDPNASAVRIKTGTGVKAIRKYT